MGGGGVLGVSWRPHGVFLLTAPRVLRIVSAKELCEGAALWKQVR